MRGQTRLPHAPDGRGACGRHMRLRDKADDTTRHGCHARALVEGQGQGRGGRAEGKKRRTGAGAGRGQRHGQGQQTSRRTGRQAGRRDMARNRGTDRRTRRQTGGRTSGQGPASRNCAAAGGVGAGGASNDGLLLTCLHCPAGEARCGRNSRRGAMRCKGFAAGPRGLSSGRAALSFITHEGFAAGPGLTGLMDRVTQAATLRQDRVTQAAPGSRGVRAKASQRVRFLSLLASLPESEGPRAPTPNPILLSPLSVPHRPLLLALCTPR